MDAQEASRAIALREAERKAGEFFDEIARDLLRPGITEKDLTTEIHKLGAERYGIKSHWHKRVVRSGPNTLSPFSDNITDRVIEPEDILFIDLGPVFEEWEADLGRTFVLGNDPAKHKLRNALEPVWHETKAHFDKSPEITGEQLYAVACEVAKKHGWEYGAPLAGHLIGDFPHERIPKDKIRLYITPGNNEVMRSVGKNGHKRHWILEIHLIDRERQIGGFFEQLLTVD